MELINVGEYKNRIWFVQEKAKQPREIAQTGRDLNMALMGRGCPLELT